VNVRSRRRGSRLDEPPELPATSYPTAVLRRSRRQLRNLQAGEQNLCLRRLEMNVSPQSAHGRGLAGSALINRSRSSSCFFLRQESHRAHLSGPSSTGYAVHLTQLNPTLPDYETNFEGGHTG
jgi:hypothetical protein